MKLGRKKVDGNGLPGSGGGGLSQPSLNKSKSNGKIIMVLLITVAMIAWVISVGKKAEETVSIVMLKENVYKNEVITEDKLMEYHILRGEYEKYGLTVDRHNDEVSKRLILWKDRKECLGMFAAFPLQRETFLEKRTLLRDRTDNSDSVLYNFPGKEIVQLNITASDLNSFKTFLQPGDRINVDAIYSEKMKVMTDDGYGGQMSNDVEVYKTEPVFNGIMIADIINGDGESVLDIYATYNTKTVQQQASLDNSDSFKEQTEPKALLVALSPDEKDSYYRFLSKSNITFKVSLPQRME